jgi:general secretion pathway protein A
MEYYKILNLTREPFSNSPEPEFFYQSPQHVECLQNLELAIRLRRGLNVVIGDVGTGKTTLCRQLISKFSGHENIRTLLLLDPDFGDAMEFLSAVGSMFGIESKPGYNETEWLLKESIKNYLFDQGVNNKNIIVLIIDEGQKIPDFCLEILREFLNYETNNNKLLQIVIFAQKEFEKTLEERNNFADRINFFYDLKPLNFSDARAMIRYRMEKSSKTGKSPVHFTYPALRAIYRATNGYPRRIVTLCHQIILTLIVQNRTRVKRSLVHSCINRKIRERSVIGRWAKIVCVSGMFAILLVFVLNPGYLRDLVYSNVFHSFQDQFSTKQITVSPKTAKTNNNDVSMERDIEKSDLNNESGESQSVGLALVALTEQKSERHGIKEKFPVDKLAGISTEIETGNESDVVRFTQKPVEYPRMLGRLQVKKGWIVSRMIANVYGFCDSGYLHLVREANPHIRDLNRVKAGDVIKFPVIPAGHEPPPWNYWVQIAKKDKLSETYGLFYQHVKKTHSMQILPYWNEREGLNFLILLKRGFVDKTSALEAIDKLPSHISHNAKIISRWAENTVLFANL